MPSKANKDSINFLDGILIFGKALDILLMKLFKVKGDFREPRCISGLVSVAKLGFSFVAIVTKEKPS
jgi:hypothetical protein